MTVVAKFYVTEANPSEGPAAGKVSLAPVCRGVENALWAQATPCGSITMYIKNDPAVDQFEKGAEYEVTFRKVAKPTPGDGHPVKPVPNMHGWLVCETCGQSLCTTPETAAQGGSHAGYAPDSEYHQQALATHEEVYGAPAAG